MIPVFVLQIKKIYIVHMLIYINMKYTKKNIFKTTEDQYEFLRRLSFESHKSMSQIIRECLKKEYPDFPFGD